MHESPGTRAALIERVLAAISESLTDHSDEELEAMLEATVDHPLTTLSGPGGAAMVQVNPESSRQEIAKDLEVLAEWFSTLAHSTLPN